MCDEGQGWQEEGKWSVFVLKKVCERERGKEKCLVSSVIQACYDDLCCLHLIMFLYIHPKPQLAHFRDRASFTYWDGTTLRFQTQAYTVPNSTPALRDKPNAYADISFWWARPSALVIFELFPVRWPSCDKCLVVIFITWLLVSLFQKTCSVSVGFFQAWVPEAAKAHPP